MPCEPSEGYTTIPWMAMTLPFATVFFLLRRICCLAVYILALHNRHATLLPIYLLAASTSRLHLKMHGGESCADLNHPNHFYFVSGRPMA